MSIEVLSGDKLPLTLVLEDGDTTKYPIAHVYNDSHVEVSGSPFSLSHLSNGVYTNNLFTAALSDKRYKAIYLIYDDLAHTILSTKYNQRLIDIFDLDTSAQAGDPRFNYLDVAISSRATPADLVCPTTGYNMLELTGSLQGITGNEALVGIIGDDFTQEVIGELESQTELSGSIMDGIIELNGVVNSLNNGQLVGIINGEV